jgi:DNA polymerase II small subunit/DNA polymerase delta subunit B
VQLGHQAFLTRARVAADTASAHKELLARYGMPENFLTEFGTALDRFEQALNEKHNGRAAHVGARAELEAVTAEIMLIVKQLDALNRFHFRKDAESLAGWKSARDVAWPLPPEKPVPPTGSAEKPAA